MKKVSSACGARSWEEKEEPPGRKLMKPFGELNRRMSLTVEWVLFVGRGGKPGRSMVLLIEDKAAGAREGTPRGSFAEPNSRTESGPKADYRAGDTRPARPTGVPGSEWLRVRAACLHELSRSAGGNHSRCTSMPVPQRGQRRQSWRVSASSESWQAARLGSRSEHGVASSWRQSASLRAR
jgi:hypothetical protein